MHMLAQGISDLYLILCDLQYPVNLEIFVGNFRTINFVLKIFVGMFPLIVCMRFS